MRRAVLTSCLLLFACDKSSSDASVDPESGDQAESSSSGIAAADPDSFEITMINRCPEQWRYYVAAAGGDGATAQESTVVADEEYTFLEGGEQTKQRLGPGDVIWLVNRKGESTATGFDSRAEGEGGRVEIQPDCDGIKRVRLAPAGS